MKYILLIGFWLLSQGVLTAQVSVPSLKKSSQITKRKGAMNLGFTVAGYFDKGGGLVYRPDFGAMASNDMYMFSLFDENMHSSGEQRFTTRYKERSVEVLKIFTRGNRICIIGSVVNQKQKTQSLIMQEVDPENFKLVTTHEIITLASNSQGFDLNAPWEHNLHLSFSLSASTDQSMFAYAASRINAKTQTTDYYLGTFSNEGELGWSFDKTLSTKQSKWQRIKMDVSNNADLVFDLFEEKLVPVTMQQKSSGKFRHLWTFRHQGETQAQYRIEPEKYRLKPFVYQLKSNGELIGVGLYEDEEENFEGIIRFTFIPEASEPEIIETDIIRSKNKADWASRTQSNGIQLTSLSCDRIILRSDGGLILLSYFGGHSNMVGSYAYAGDFIVCSMDPEGNIEWNQRIETKATRIANLWHKPYQISVQSDRIWIFFNNAKEDANDKYYYLHRFKESQVEAASISLNGEVSRTTLSTYPKKSTYIDAYTLPRIEKDRILLVGGTDSSMEIWEIKF